MGFSFPSFHIHSITFLWECQGFFETFFKVSFYHISVRMSRVFWNFFQSFCRGVGCLWSVTYLTFPSPFDIVIVPHFGGLVKGFCELFSNFLFATRVRFRLPFPFRHDYYTINMLQEKNESVTILLNRRPAKMKLAGRNGRVTADSRPWSPADVPVCTS